MIQLCIVAPFKDKFKALLEEEFSKDYQIIYCDKNDIEQLKKAEVIVGGIPVDTLKQLPDLKLLQGVFAGVDNYTENPETPKHFTLCHVTDVFGVVISEFIIGGILAVYHNFYQYHENQKNHIWTDLGRDDTICGKNVLILGTGDIGGNTAKRLKAFDCHITGLNRSGKTVKFFDHIDTLDHIDQYLETTDLLICALPSNKETIDFIDYKRLKKIKKDSVIINIGRGSLFAEGAIEQIIEEDHLRYVVMDVFREEPLPTTSPLWDNPKVIMTPHISGKGFYHNELTEGKIYENVRRNLANYRDQKPLHGVIKL